jgi:hypothetical protein
MNHTVTIQELAIVIATENHNPTILNLDFLKCSGIVEEDWQLSRSPICHSQASQIVFQNGISLASQPDRIIFAEAIAANRTPKFRLRQSPIAISMCCKRGTIEPSALILGATSIVTKQKSLGSI